MGKWSNGFVPDGPTRHRRGLDLEAEAATIETEVRAEFAPRIAQASGLGRWGLILRRRLEIRRRVQALGPGRYASWARR